jgi:hypothetical protein
LAGEGPRLQGGDVSKAGEAAANHQLEAEEKERALEERVHQFHAAQEAQAAPGAQVVEVMKKTLEDL